MNPAYRRSQRWRIYHRDNGQCRYCGRVVLLPFGTLDHIRPKAQGGTGEAANLAWACFPCNNAKGDIPLADMGVTRHEVARFWRIECIGCTD